MSRAPVGNNGWLVRPRQTYGPDRRVCCTESAGTISASATTTSTADQSPLERHKFNGTKRKLTPGAFRRATTRPGRSMRTARSSAASVKMRSEVAGSKPWAARTADSRLCNAGRTCSTMRSARSVGTISPPARTKSGSLNMSRRRFNGLLVAGWLKPTSCPALETLRRRTSADNTHRRFKSIPAALIGRSRAPIIRSLNTLM